MQLWSYRLSMLLVVISALMQVSVMLFLGRLLERSDHPRFAAGEYLGFGAVGLAALSLVNGVSTSAASWWREGQLTGTLEAVLSCPTPHWRVVLHVALAAVPAILLQVMVELGLAGLLGAQFVVNWRLPLALLLSAWVSLPATLLATALIAMLKRSDLVSFALVAGSLLLSGIYFPRDILPTELQLLANGMPTTHVVDVLRAALLPGGEKAFFSAAGRLAVYGLCIWPVGVCTLAFAIRFGTIKGTLTQY